MLKRAATVAIIDDSAIIRYSVNYVLKSKGFPVLFEADNGAVCLEIMTSLAVFPDILILDIEMPVMDGYTTASIVKKNWPTIQIIAFSGREDQASISRSIKAGADYFFSKNDDLNNLLDLLHKISGNHL
ncbi:response regulator [Dyadobacter luteus]|uniref:Response regulator n=1 Tax=Dyadobacter luteus TaxID=2259619 RepID=A0A3D8Y3F1_9BACT|nr:response regulator [Dyadobacter luteus]REA56511.1 response regulator [Dyadobacter luteus]